MGQRPDEMARVQARTGRTHKESFPQLIQCGEQGLPLLPMSAKQHQAQAMSSERVEISARKYDPDLTGTERVL